MINKAVVRILFLLLIVNGQSLENANSKDPMRMLSIVAFAGVVEGTCCHNQFLDESEFRLHR
jgi:hypothetical protein